MKRYIVYSDGACSNNQDGAKRVAAFAASIFTPIKGKTFKKDIEGVYPGATNNQVELLGVLEALKVILKIDPSDTPEVEVFSDSNYVVEGVNKWLDSWKASNWQTKGGSAVKNVELWKEFSDILGKTRCTFKHVPGDNTVPWNKYCDERARKLCGSRPKRQS